MGNKAPDKDAVLLYIREGWRFRIKNVKGRKYITRRKDQVERGLGPFDHGLWSLINQLFQQTSAAEAPSVLTDTVLEKDAGERKNGTPKLVHPAEKQEMAFRKLLDTISMYRGIVMMRSCAQLDGDGFCTYWKWENKPKFFELFDDILMSEYYEKKKMSINGRTVEMWIIKAIHWYCSRCPVYKPIKNSDN